MIRYGVPYTCEDGNIDNKVISDSPLPLCSVVHDWVYKNIQQSSEVDEKHTNCVLVNMLYSDTGVRITPNQFKDVMLRDGHRPLDPDEFDWKYCIKLRDKDKSLNAFVRWAKKYKYDKSPKGKFVRDMLSDEHFCLFANRSAIRLYLSEVHATGEVFGVFNELWKEYEETLDDKKVL